MKTQKTETNFNVPEIKEYKNKYRLAAEEIYSILGAGNYQNVYNCMTRFRTNVSDRKRVDLEQIKKIPVVKGVQWNGNELQIIIGGEVIKVVDEFKKYEEELLKPKTKSDSNQPLIKEKISIGRKLLAAVAGIMGPTIPILMITGLIASIYAMLTLPGNEILTTSVQTGVNDKGEPIMAAIGMDNLHLFDLASGMMFILSKILLNSIGVFFIYNTARFLKGNTWFAIAIGITLMARGFWPAGGGTSLADAQFGQWLSDAGPGKSGKSGWFLFQLGTYPIVVGGYEGAIIPFIFGGIILTFTDKWIKTWMPTTVDVVFRPFLVYIITIFGLWFLIAPVASLIEFGLITGMTWIGKIPYGFGTGLVAVLWQPLVLTGAHLPVAMGMSLEVIQTGASLTRAAIVLGVWGQVGTAIGVGIITRNMNLKRIALGAIPAGIFGITEPIIYGVNLPKVRPFLLGCLAALPGGMLIGALDLPKNVPSGQGIFEILGFTEGPLQMGLVLLSWAVTIGTAILLAIFFYKERKNESTYFKKSIHKMIKFINGDKVAINKEFESYESELKGLKTDYKKLDKYYSEVSKFENKLIGIENQETKARESMYKKLIKLKDKLMNKNDTEILNKFNTLNEKYSSYNLDNEKVKIQNSLDKVISENKPLLDKMNKEKEDIYNKSIKLVDKHKMDEIQTMVVKNMMWNAVNSVEVGYGIEDAKAVKFKKGA